MMVLYIQACYKCDSLYHTTAYTIHDYIHSISQHHVRITFCSLYVIQPAVGTTIPENHTQQIFICVHTCQFEVLYLCTSALQIEIHQMLERCLRDSRCLDTESLCIVFGQKVWQIRVDVHVLNFDGNITDAASIAAIAALSHFRRPDVTVCGDEITIHSVEDRYDLFFWYLSVSFWVVDNCYMNCCVHVLHSWFSVSKNLYINQCRIFMLFHHLYVQFLVVKFFTIIIN